MNNSQYFIRKTLVDETDRKYRFDLYLTDWDGNTKLIRELF